MTLARLVLVAAVTATSAVPPASAAPASAAPASVTPAPADPAKVALEAAKAQRSTDRAKARAAFVAAFDAQVKAAGSAGDLDALKSLTAQKDAFLTAGVLPNLPGLKDAVAQYTLATRKADGQLVGAYESAIQTYTDAQKFDDAMALRKERQALLSGAADAPAANTPDGIALVLERAKGDYQQQVADAKAAYIAAIQARVDAATKLGDLNLVTTLRAAKAAAEADQSLPPGLNDPAVANGQTRYGQAVQGANQRLATAYREAVRGMTRAGKIDKAQEIQAELEATGLVAATAAAAAAAPLKAGGGGGSSDSATKLARILPSYLSASDTYAPEKDGIRPARQCVISTKATDFLSRDFVFDVTVVVPKAGDRDDGAVVGLGDGTDAGSLRVGLRQDGGFGKRAFLALGDRWGKHFGDLRPGEAYVVRVKRVGGPVTVSVGQVVDGKYVAESSQTVGEPTAAVAGLSEKRAKLFFSGETTFTHVRLATGANAVALAAAEGGAAAEATPAGGASAVTVVRFPVGVGRPIAPGGPADAAAKGVYPLTSAKLPPGFTATGTYSVSPGGVTLSETRREQDRCLITTKDEDFLSKDFVLDLWVTVPKGEENREGLVVGIGDGTQQGSIRLLVRQDGGWGVRAFLALGDEWGKHFGDLRTVGPRVIRLERHGGPITVSVGTDENGTFVPDMSQTVADPKAANGKISERRAKLFFGGPATWSKVRLVTGADAGGAPVVPAAPAVPVKPAGKGRK